MRTPVTIVTALLTVGVLASPAAAAKPVPIPSPPPMTFQGFCGGSITLTILKNNVKSSFVDQGVGFTDRLRGNFVLEVRSGTRTAIVRTPGQVRVIGTEDSLTISSIGRTLLLPFFEADVDAQREAGLPDLALVSGRVVSTATLDPATRTPIETEISYTGRVTDVCDLLR